MYRFQTFAQPSTHTVFLSSISFFYGAPQYRASRVAIAMLTMVAMVSPRGVGCKGARKKAGCVPFCGTK